MKKINLKVEAVIFDMDGVITNTMPDHFRAWRDVLGKEGIRVGHYDIYSREGQPGIVSVREISTQHKKTFSERKLQKILKDKEECFKEVARIRFILGARSFVKSLHAKGVRLALVTGTARHEVDKILPRHLLDLFETVVTGNDVKHGKPHPEPFAMALTRLKLNPKKAIAVENAPYGIQSANAAGLKCIALETSLPKQHLKKAKYTFSSIKDLRKKINFLSNGHGS